MGRTVIGTSKEPNGSRQNGIDGTEARTRKKKTLSRTNSFFWMAIITTVYFRFLLSLAGCFANLGVRAGAFSIIRIGFGLSLLPLPGEKQCHMGMRRRR